MVSELLAWELSAGNLLAAAGVFACGLAVGQIFEGAKGEDRKHFAGICAMVGCLMILVGLEILNSQPDKPLPSIAAPSDK